MPTTASMPRASTRRSPPARCAPHRHDRVQVGALHQPFLVDVRIEELLAERLELPDRLDRGRPRRFLPALDDHLAALAVDRGDDPLGTDRGGEVGGEGEIRPAAAEQRRADDDRRRAVVEHGPCAFDAADPAADAAGELRGDMPHQRIVGARAQGRVEVDQLHAREPLEPAHPGCDVVRRERRPLALDELHDLAALEIDGGDEHRRGQSLTGMPRPARCCLRSTTARSA